MNIQYNDNAVEGEFFIVDEQGKKIATLAYCYEGAETINAHHTFVADTLRGQGVADRLYRALVQFVQEKHLNLHPTCSYIERKWARDNRE